MKIAVLLTCHNRCAKTVACMKSLAEAYTKYKQSHECVLTVFLTDDGCTDGTVSKVFEVVEGRMAFCVISGNGDYYWAGGMRAAWNAAMKDTSWDYFLLLNDDVTLLDNLFEELFNTNEYCLKTYNQQGVYSGITCAVGNAKKTTYGGWANKKKLQPIGTPQMCDVTNANILMVPMAVVDKMGIFYSGYHHGFADYDYCLQARKRGIPVLVTSNTCGECDNDHKTKREIADKLISMSISERKAYFKHPLHSSKDYQAYIKRNFPSRYPFSLFAHWMNIYIPRLYYKLKL